MFYLFREGKTLCSVGTEGNPSRKKAASKPSLADTALRWQMLRFACAEFFAGSKPPLCRSHSFSPLPKISLYRTGRAVTADCLASLLRKLGLEIGQDVRFPYKRNHAIATAPSRIYRLPLL